MLTAWTYCLRGWLVALMVNPRRRRAVIAGITLSFILLCQLPNLLNLTTQAHRRKQRQAQQETKQQDRVAEVNVPAASAPPRPRRPVPDWALTVHRVVPVLWIGYGARSLTRGDIGSALLGTLGSLGLGLLGLRRAYRATLGFYLGTASGKRRRIQTPRSAPNRHRPLFVHRSLPGFSEVSSTLGLTFLRSNLRAPEIKMMLGTSFIMLFVFGGVFFARSRAKLPVDLKPLATAGAVVVTFFGLTQLMFNLFGADRSGFRALVLCPCARRRILLGKNISVFPFALVLGSALLLVCLVFLQFGLLTFVCGWLQLGTGFLLLSMMGNLCSILMPYRIAPGSLKPTKPPALLILMQFVTHLCFPVIVFPVFVPPLLGLLATRTGWANGDLLNLLSSAVTLGLAIFFYRRSLGPLGRLLQRREQRILETVTREVE
jgi:ABC-2 type transport system permease protein